MTHHQTLLELHKSGEWVCSARIEFMRDHRKRYSELRQKGYIFDSRKCTMGHNHSSGLFMRRLVAPQTLDLPRQAPLPPKKDILATQPHLLEYQGFYER